MPGKLLPLRLLGFAALLRSSARTARTAVVTPAVLVDPLAADLAGAARAFSSRPSRSGGGFGGPRGPRNVGARSGSSARPTAAKSLIEDEADPYDWVSDLKKDSFRMRLSSDSGDDSDHDGSRSSRGRWREPDSNLSTRSRAPKWKQRGSDSDDFNETSERRPRGSVGPGGRSPERSVSTRRFGSDLEDEGEDSEDDFSSRRIRGGGGGGGISSSLSRRGGRNLGSSYRQDRIGSSYRQDRVGSRSVRDDEDDNDDFSTRRTRGGGGRGGISSRPAGRGGRNLDSSNRHNWNVNRPVLAVLEEEDGDDDDDDDDDDDSDDDFSSRGTRGGGRRGEISSRPTGRGGRNLNPSNRHDRIVKRPILGVSEEEDGGDDDSHDGDDDTISGLEEDFFGKKVDESGGSELSEGETAQPPSKSSI